jgi:hypothetical protein
VRSPKCGQEQLEIADPVLAARFFDEAAVQEEDLLGGEV